MNKIINQLNEDAEFGKKFNMKKYNFLCKNIEDDGHGIILTLFKPLNPLNILNIGIYFLDHIKNEYYENESDISIEEFIQDNELIDLK